MRIVLTGGVGFIGYHVARALLERGDELTIVDDYSNTPYPTAFKRRNERDLRNQFSGVQTLDACVTNAEKMEPCIRSADGIIHLAGLAGVRPSFASPARYARVNVEGTSTIIQLAQAHGVRRMVFASSSSVYGNSTPLPAQEDSPAVCPESPYAASKRSAELVASALLRKSPEMACAALRFFTVYGPRQRPEMAITLFARALLEQRPINMFGDGSMRRDFTHVNDIVLGILAALEKAPLGFRPYNLGSGSPVDLLTLVRAIGAAVGVEPAIKHSPVPLGDVDATFADISRARDELGWSPKVALREGIATVIDWVRNNALSE